jgi:integrase
MMLFLLHQFTRELQSGADETSQKPIPLDGTLAAALLDWSLQTPYRQLGDWVFASPKLNGKQPYWPELLECYVQPAAKGLGITKQIERHSFRRAFATLLEGGGEEVQTVQELMRQANSRLMLDLYAQALTPAKRAAHSKVVEMIRSQAGTPLVPLWFPRQRTQGL